MKQHAARVAALLVACAVTGCAAAPPSSNTLSPPGEITLQAGAQAVLPGQATLRYLGVSNDSRCPPQVQCIQAGDADVGFQYEADGQRVDVTLNTARATTRAIGPWSLHLLRLAHGPAPAVTVRIDDQPGRVPP
ncbi:hypothetical protein ACFOLC_09065 [Lysobacter cavernae]|uniref:Lipoprotein n=1 Tax=Lysobacter cavernae TaxID=1685901 RepID=A0ABV7RQU5_9GAMM